MSNVIQITSNNFNGQYADITFYPCSGGSISLGYQLLPYDYAQDNYEGTYDIYVSAYTLTCQLVITCPSPTPSITPTSTVTPSVTPTLTPTPTDPRTCRTYTIANNGFACSNFDWTNCDGSLSSTTLCFGASTNICAKQGSVSQQSPNGSITDIGTCPLPSPTPTPTNTSTPTPTLTPTPSPVVEYHLQAENGDNILAENGDFIDIEHT